MLFVFGDEVTKVLRTLKSLIEEHARLDFPDFLSSLLAIFPPARLLFYFVK